jgi:hypothetical protein
MAGITAVRRVPRAIREIKLTHYQRMNYQGEGWEPVREGARKAVAEILEDRMKKLRRSYP